MLYRRIKNILDPVIAFVMLTAVSPLILCISLLILIFDGPEVFVKEPLRIGKDGKEFKMYKFRTMKRNAHNEINNNPEYSELKQKWLENDGKLRLDEDPRVYPFGRMLRKTDIDELPQLINVVFGQMSLVGPRPMYEQEKQRYLSTNRGGNKLVKKILTVKPGLTGIWQVSGRNDIGFADRMILESKYVDSMNLFEDMKIFFKTPYVILSRRGAHE